MFVVVVVLTYAIIAVLVVPYIGKDLPYSKFYQSTPERDKQRNLEDNFVRLQEANIVLSNPFSIFKDPSVLPEFCFIVVSISRPANMEFLTQVVAGLVTQLAGTNSVFALYNAEGSTHLEALKLSSTISVISNPKQSATVDKFSKEKEDLVFALQWCYKKKARYTVIFEDDALPLPYFMTRLQFILKQRMPHYKQDWAFLKLFYPPKWQGWSNELHIIKELILTSLIGSFVLTSVAYFVQIVCKNRHTNYPKKCDLILLVTLSFIFSMYTLWTLGRPHWLVLLGNISFHFNFIVPAPGCCTPAVLYPQEHISNLINYLNSVTCSLSFPVDIALDTFVMKQGLKQLMVVPDLIKHIGFVSSLGKGWKDPIEFRF